MVRYLGGEAEAIVPVDLLHRAYEDLAQVAKTESEFEHVEAGH